MTNAGPSVAFEDPSALLGRLRLGREEFCQRLLTMLILGGPYPRWNTRSVPTDAGLKFLDDLHRRSFGEPLAGQADCVFVDEFDLPRRSDAEPGGAPDYAVVTEGRLWLIELKTEKSSHRHGQVPQYFELGRHHHPESDIDITYLTPAMTAVYEPPGPWARFAHLTWSDAAEAIRSTWGAVTDAGERRVVDRLLATLDELETVTASQWRTSTERVAPLVVEAVPVELALALAAEVAADGSQRALDLRAGDLEELQRLRLAVRDRLCATPVGSDLRHVMAWLWQPSSSGQPLTAAGAELGYELRLSRYEKPVC